MSYRTAIVLLVISLFVVDMPVRNAATRNNDSASAQDPSLLLSATSVSQPGGGTALNLTGKYQSGGKTVNLRSTTVKSGFHIRPTGPPSQSPSAPEQGYQPETDYYSSNSEMSKSDGTVLVEAVYDYEQPTGRSALNITMDGVTVTFDLNTQEPGAFSDADADTLNNWLATDDGRLLQDACVSVVDQGGQQVDPEALQNYYAVAMLVDTNPPPQSKSNEKKNNALHASLARFKQRLSRPGNASIMKTSWTPDNSVPDKEMLLTVPCASPQGGCYGCCGWGCHCIRDRGGVVIYNTYCLQHDSCSGQYGRLGRPCLFSLAGSIVAVWYRIRPF